MLKSYLVETDKHSIIILLRRKNHNINSLVVIEKKHYRTLK